MMMHDIAQEQPRTNCRACVLAGRMFQAAILAVFIGTAIFGLYAVANGSGETDIMTFPLICLAVGMWAVPGVFLVVALIAFPIRLFWKRPLSVAFMTIGSALAGGLLYGLPMILSVHQVSESGLMLVDGSVGDYIDAVLPTFLIGALYGGLFGFVYGVLETQGQKVSVV